MQRTEAKRAAISFAALVVSYLVYATWIAPIIEPPVIHRSTSAEAQEPTGPRAVDRYREELSGWFPADAWEMQSPKVLRNRNVLLLFQDYQPQPDGTIRIFPCTVVLREEQAAAPSVLILQAPEGAILQLNRPVDLKGAQLGQPVAGRLLGRIQIHSPGRPDGTGKLNVVTSNVQINAQRLWTPNEVALQYEQSHARGRDLMIKLMPPQAAADPGQSAGWAGLRAVELVHLEQLHLEIAQRDPRNPPATTPATPIDVSCQGPLRIDFLESLMTFEDNVQLRRTNLDGKLDTLNCDRLSFHLHQAPDERPARDATAESTAAGQKPASAGARANARLPRIEISRVVAEGNPVTLDAESQQAHVRSQKLLYDLQQGRFRLWAKAEDPADQVLLKYRQQDMAGRTLDCQLDADGNVTRVAAEGPGTFGGELPGKEPQPVAASWRERLVYQLEGDLYHLAASGAADVQVGSTDGIRADVIHLWLEPLPPDSSRDGQTFSTPTNAAASLDADGRRAASLALRPKRLTAMTRPESAPAEAVQLRSRGILATTRHLDATFTHEPPGDTRTAAHDFASPAATATLPVHAGLSDAAADAAASPSPRPVAAAMTNDNSLPLERTTHVSGRALNVTLHMRGRETTVHHLVLNDQVQVAQYSVRNPSTPLFSLAGDAVQIQDLSSAMQADAAHYLITANGAPVQMKSERMQLFTRDLRVDQSQNVAWTDQPGRMIMLVDRDAQGRQLAKPQQMTIDWHRRMDFDGQIARFEGRIEVRGPDQRLRAEKLFARLNQRIAFGKAAGNVKFEIEQLRADGNVIIETQERPQSELTSFSYMQVPFAELHRTTGELRAGGPGRLITRRVGFEGNPAIAVPPTANAGPDRTSDAQDRLTYLQVDYQRQISGNLHRRIIEFENRVQVIYGPVTSWNESIRPDAPLGKNDVLLSCDRLTLAEGVMSTATQRSIDLIAQGNAYVEGQAFTARGERLSYDQSKDQLVLEGTGHTDAVLSHQARVGAPRSETVARKILYWPKSQRVDFDDARYLDLSNLGR
jgi:lipopolysaccharide export system protein LptA